MKCMSVCLQPFLEFKPLNLFWPNMHQIYVNIYKYKYKLHLIYTKFGENSEARNHFQTVVNKHIFSQKQNYLLIKIGFNGYF